MEGGRRIDLTGVLAIHERTDRCLQRTHVGLGVCVYHELQLERLIGVDEVVGVEFAQVGARRAFGIEERVVERKAGDGVSAHDPQLGRSVDEARRTNTENSNINSPQFGEYLVRINDPGRQHDVRGSALHVCLRRIVGEGDGQLVLGDDQGAAAERRSDCPDEIVDGDVVSQAETVVNRLDTAGDIHQRHELIHRHRRIDVAISGADVGLGGADQKDGQKQRQDHDTCLHRSLLEIVCWENGSQLPFSIKVQLSNIAMRYHTRKRGFCQCSTSLSTGFIILKLNCPILNTAYSHVEREMPDVSSRKHPALLRHHCCAWSTRRAPLNSPPLAMGLPLKSVMVTN